MEGFKFVKEYNKWYVVLPEWEGPKADLEMVLGADTMLDIIAQGEHEVTVVISTKPFDGSNFTLTYLREESEGGWYHLKGQFHEFELWLCKVTKFVFGDMPEKLYIG